MDSDERMGRQTVVRRPDKAGYRLPSSWTIPAGRGEADPGHEVEERALGSLNGKSNRGMAPQEERDS